MLNAAFFSAGSVPAAFGSPAVVVGGTDREGSDGKMNHAFGSFLSAGSGVGVGRRASGRGSRRKSQIIEEEEEDGLGHGVIGEEEEDEVEEVDAFQAVELGKGERVQSITIWDDVEGEAEGDDVVGGLKNFKA
jgi:hypothetical protein